MNLSELVNGPAIFKVTLFFGVWGLLWLPIAIATAMLLNWHPPQPLDEKQKPILLASLYLIVPLIIDRLSRVENQSFADYGWLWQLSTGISLISGLSISILSLVVFFGVEWILGWIAWQPQPQFQLAPDNFLSKILSAWGSLLSILLLALWISGTEEFVFRGFVQYHLQQDYTVVIAAIITSVIFALTHLIWEFKQTIPQLPGLWLMGMVLTLACVYNQNLGLAIGLHAGWIWGITSIQTLGNLTSTRRAPQWVTGIGDQPLAGVMGITMLLAVAGLLWLVYN
ncbi:CPBP family intramembrane glutamic endopeptidase [Capilliphycus salinus ALCB114379]|uniref:CPBP family intramembrane glutamic endopeptidase n=1 Tax=Capilliphycus salinus TaxID=2768948 RepID=UPI0039A628D0